jgi:hypothetical protein
VVRSCCSESSGVRWSYSLSSRTSRLGCLFHASASHSRSQRPSVAGLAAQMARNTSRAAGRSLLPPTPQERHAGPPGPRLAHGCLTNIEARSCASPTAGSCGGFHQPIRATTSHPRPRRPVDRIRRQSGPAQPRLPDQPRHRRGDRDARSRQPTADGAGPHRQRLVDRRASPSQHQLVLLAKPVVEGATGEAGLACHLCEHQVRVAAV